ncbi:acyl-CoA synthetase (AMP-forming)/AMP-acid ligase II [Roseinatronobacter thiooxidans]|uniref:Acyl-CoA synthetase (AMP-forming)/AMP-acid ligase II n=1 Tax=Roseinatronobacter thiooxidans TaxID=121821 RepID=A0A2W7QBV0_9RHOB|nr:class I adenylate-forming enzyme family protein [Roseinatronobacter thiooxidans]PZX45633.1 acyl-CoA synthetase (AMP-forming)/AMP-acid ligase II [Roseinatronobacter thiooxidans]
MLSLTDPTRPERCPAPFNMAQYVLSAGAATPDKSALQILRASGAERWSYARLIAAVRGTGQGLLAAGLQPGDRVLMRLGNTVDFPVAYLGAIAAGLVPVPTSTQLTVLEITRISHEIAPALVLGAEGVALPDHPAPVLAQSDLHAMQDLPPCDWHMGSPDRAGYIIYTSGSGGSPRAVVHAHRAVWARRMMWDGWYGLTPDDRMLHAGAFNWTYTLGTGLMDPWAIGATALIPDAGAPLALMLKRFDATLFAGVPGVYRQLLKEGRALDLPRLRHGLSAGEKLPDVTRDAWRAATGREIYEALGMSECSTYISASPARPAPAGVAGYPQEGRKIAILDDAGAPLPRESEGMLAIHRSDPGLMLGYLQDGAPQLPLLGEWFVTGDRGQMAQDGAIAYRGRNDDMMNAGGFRVSPLEVERALASHPAIHDIACAEVSVREGVSVIAAFYTADAPLDEEALQAYAAERLARYKQPRLYRHCDSLPRGANGKLSRRALRDSYQGGGA